MLCRLCRWRPSLIPYVTAKDGAMLNDGAISSGGCSRCLSSRLETVAGAKLALAVRQLTFVEAGRVEWQEAPDAVVPDPAGAVVRPLAVARCDLDLPMATAGLFP